MKYTKGYKYVTEDITYYDTDILGYNIETDGLSLIETGNLRISERYPWDGASGPALDTDNFMLASLIHDALYELMREELLPPECKDAADRLMRKICLEKGMWKLRAWLVYWGVRKYGLSSTLPENKRKIHEA